MRAVNPPGDDMLGNGPLAAELDAGHLALAWGTATAFADRPGKVMATSPDMARSMSVQMNVMDRVMQSRTEAVISSPYFIPGEAGVKAFGDLRRRNVEVSVLTNSLAANDVPLVHAGYANAVNRFGTRRYVESVEKILNRVASKKRRRVAV